MVYAGSRFCKIVKNEEGNLIGDCECCMKNLGYGCPGLLAVRNHLGLLKKSLEKLTMVVQSKNTGDGIKKGVRGLGTSKTKRRNSSILPPQADKSEYFNQKESKDIMDLARRWSLFSREQLNSMEKLKDEVQSPDDLKSYDDWRTNQSKEKLSMFVQDPRKYRKEQPTTYK
jgi:hypothetical protein